MTHKIIGAPHNYSPLDVYAYAVASHNRNLLAYFASQSVIIGAPHNYSPLDVYAYAVAPHNGNQFTGFASGEMNKRYFILLYTFIWQYTGKEKCMNKKIILVILPLLIIAAAATIGFWTKNNTSEAEKNINLYFFNEKESSIVPESRSLKYNNADDLVNLALNALIKGPSDGKLKPIMSKNTKVRSENMNESQLTVDFTNEFMHDDVTKNMLAVYAIVRTLCQIDKVGNVMVTVDGTPVAAADGGTIGFLSNSDINLESDTYTTDSKNIILYFADRNTNKLAKEARTIKITDTSPIESYVINELIKGPVTKELSATLTSDTELVSVETTNGTCHVTFKNFTDKNLSDPNDPKSMLAVYSVVNSLTQLPEIDSVRFLFEGKTVDTLGPFNFSDVFVQNNDLIE